MKNPTIYTYSVIYSTTPAFVDRVPYATALLERENGEKFASILLGYKEGMNIEIGQEVNPAGIDEKGNELYSL